MNAAHCFDAALMMSLTVLSTPMLAVLPLLVEPSWVFTTSPSSCHNSLSVCLLPGEILGLMGYLRLLSLRVLYSGQSMVRPPSKGLDTKATPTMVTVVLHGFFDLADFVPWWVL